MRSLPVGLTSLRSIALYVLTLLACTTQRTETQKPEDAKNLESQVPDTGIVKPDTVDTKNVDELVGIWSLDPSEGTYEYTVKIWPNGAAEQRLFGQTAPGSWRRLKNSKYAIEPGGANDYAILKNGRLEMWDRQGLIRGFKRIGNAADLLTPVPERKAKSTRSESKVLSAESVRPIAGLSYAQVMRDLDTMFAMKQSTKVPRRVGSSYDKLAVLEVNGTRDKIYSVTLLSMIVKEAVPLSAARAILNSVILVRNVAPGWIEGRKWVANAIGDAGTTQEPLLIIHDGKRFKVSAAPGMVWVHVEPE